MRGHLVLMRRAVGHVPRAGPIAVASWLLFVVAAAVSAAAASWTGPGNDVTQTAAAGVAAWACVGRRRRALGRARWGWVALAVGTAAWATGQAIWSVYEIALNRDSPFPSWADAGFLTFPVAASFAVFLFPAGQGRLRARDGLDGLVLALCLGTLSTAAGLTPMVSGQSRLVQAVSLAYPVSDVIILTMAMLAVGRARHHRRTVGLVAAAMAAMAISDSFFTLQTASGTYSSTNYVALGWIGAFAFISTAAAVAAVESSAAGQAGAGGRRSRIPVGTSLLPYLGLLAAATAVLADQAAGGGVSAPVRQLFGAAVALTLARQYLTVRHNGVLVRELEHRASHDALTGLANRSLFVEHLDAALAEHRGSGRALAVLFCDLDQFKGINDGLGHAAGDALLVHVGRRLRGALGPHAIIARLGGDEFAILLQDQDFPRGSDQADRQVRDRDVRNRDVGDRDARVRDAAICPDDAPTRPAATQALRLAAELCECLGGVFTVAGTGVSVRLSMGIATVPAGAGTPSADAVLAHADTAMYTAKRTRCPGPVLYRPGLTLPESEDWHLLPAARQALATGAITAHYQPIVALADQELYAFEALARWPRPGGSVEPATFLPVLARAGMTPYLTRHMLNTVAGQLVAWGPVPGARIAVNVSPLEIIDPGFPALIESLLDTFALPWGSLLIEITEEALLRDTQAASTTATALRELGVAVSLDDFGAGYASLAHLHRLPLDHLKLDRAFVATVDIDPDLRILLRGVLHLAQDLHLTVIAEGIERPDQARALHDLGCPLGQGYLFSPARPAAEHAARFDVRARPHPHTSGGPFRQPARAAVPVGLGGKRDRETASHAATVIEPSSTHTPGSSCR